METLKMSKWTYAGGLSLAITSIINAILVIIKESNKQTFLVWMRMMTGHQWVTQGVISIILFFTFVYIFASLQSKKGVVLTTNTLFVTVVGGVSLSAIIIAGYFLF